MTCVAKSFAEQQAFFRYFTIVAVSLLSAIGCGGDDDNTPPNVAGHYTINVTNGQNNCPLTGWQEGQSFSNITFDVTQDGENLLGTFQGVLATIFLQAVIGATDFQGTVSHQSVEMTRLGTQTFTSGACMFTVRADLQGTSNGDVLQGQIVYKPVTHDDPDCASIESCSAVQMFNGTRPP
jgi:hypothetical protein